MDIGQSIIFKNIEKNYLLITYNPVLALALYVEYMKQIIARMILLVLINYNFNIDFNVFDTTCKIIVLRIKNLGKIIIDNM